MIHIVITVLAVPSDAVEVTDSIDILLDFRDIFIAIKISRVSFFHFFFGGIDDIFFIDDLDGAEFIDCHLDEIIFLHRPKFIAFRRKVFKANPDMFSDVIHQVWRPVIKDLESP